MSKEIYISTTPHETRLAIMEDEQLAEIYFERENEYTLAGSIYNGKVTRVLPGMQSSFVDIGLERDAFLYVTDFMEEQGDSADFETTDSPRQPSRESRGRDRDRDRDKDRSSRRERPSAAATETDITVSFDEPIAPAPSEGVAVIDSEGEAAGSRRWRGRRGRRRGRAFREDQPAGTTVEAPEGESLTLEGGYQDDEEVSSLPSLEAGADETPKATFEQADRPRSGRDRERRGDRDRRRGSRDRGSDRSDRAPRDADAPRYDNSYAGYGSPEEHMPESGEFIVLPGESVRKYRDPAEVAAEDEEARRNAPPAPPVTVVRAPSFEVTGWDGGNVLPGESLSRHRGRAVPPAKPGRVATPPVEQPLPPVEEAALSADLGAEPGVVIAAEAPEAVAADAQTNVSEGITAAGEYEPGEGASASTVGNSRRDLRRATPQPEAKPEISAEAETAIEAALPDMAAAVEGSKAEPEPATPDATAYDLNESSNVADEPAAPVPAEPEFTALQPGGEMLSIPADPISETSGFTPIPQQDAASPALPVEHEDAVQAVNLAQAETLPAPAAAEEETVESEMVVTELHAYGDGDFQEEEIEDTDEFEFEPLGAHAEDSEADQYEEETLEGSTDLGSLLHEMQQDRETGDEEDFEDAGEEEESASGGFTEADFAGETDEDEEAEGTAPAAPATGQRGRGEHRRGSFRDRRGGRNSGGDRGRGRRQSMQTTDMPAINELLKPGQEILVQIAKEPIAKKGARITSHIALPGRFLVFMPTVNHIGVSRKISSDEERRRLKSILLSEKGDAQGGFIVRTAAGGASEEELRTDLRFLIQMWNDIKMRSEASKSPALIYHDLNLVERILRDQVTDNFSAIWVDTEQEYERVLRFLQRFQPSLVRRVKLYTKETPVFEHFGINAEIDKALKSKVWLKSGGSIVINQTEALVAIDINTGKYVGKTARLEDTILKTNLDSIPEIVRQIRLRDLGGIIVIDFIDMDERKNRAKVLQALEDAMKSDRAPSKILPFNDFGLVIMTRKRVKQSLERTLCIPDPVTEGTGMIKSPVTVANEIYVEMKKMYRHLEKTDVMLRVHPDVVKTLKGNNAKRLQELEDMTRKTILLKSDPSLSPEAFDIH